ncbi:MAG: ParA family protein [Synergistaceae bacterium]|jgi:chromosome partitioning protein|nr:ParA family protein [Synergistaceae bacterium]
MKKPIIVSVLNYKGGVGKTTVTANLAAYAASKGHRVLMVDLDPQASLTFSFLSVHEYVNVYMSKTLKQFFEPYTKGKSNAPSLDELQVSVYPKDIKLDLLSSHLGLMDIDAEFIGRLMANTQNLLAANFISVYSLLRDALNSMQTPHDLVLIDCPPSFNTMVKNAIVASNMCIIPTRMDFLSTFGIDQLNARIASYVEQYNDYAVASANSTIESPEILGLVPTMVTLYRGGLINDAAELQSAYEKRYHMFPWLQERATFYGKAPSTGIPAVLGKYYIPSSRTALGELEKLGAEFLKAVNLPNG